MTRSLPPLVRRLAVALTALPVLGAALLAQAPAAGATASAARKPLPLDAGRTVRFTTDKASWMSVDVSPDGQRIVFDLLGDLYTL
ncbi:MAG: hypothetical protein KJZ74_09465, partial [Gemmatimonadales bacterium]|nr:hypothetical protein [Gemmatimonadales bacterium]